MSNNRKVAVHLMTEGAQTIANRRPGVHGSAEDSFEMIGDLWTTYLRHARKVRGNDTVRGEDVAEMMSMLKKARKIYGNPTNIDNDVDDLGYTALAGMIRLPDILAPKSEQIEENLDKLDPQQPGNGNVVGEDQKQCDHSFVMHGNGGQERCSKCGLVKIKDSGPLPRADGGANIKSKHKDIRGR